MAFDGQEALWWPAQPRPPALLPRTNILANAVKTARRRAFHHSSPSLQRWRAGGKPPLCHQLPPLRLISRQVIHGKVISVGVWVLQALVNSCVSPRGCIYKSAPAAAVFRAVPKTGLFLWSTHVGNLNRQSSHRARQLYRPGFFFFRCFLFFVSRSEFSQIHLEKLQPGLVFSWTRADKRLECLVVTKTGSCCQKL